MSRPAAAIDTADTADTPDTAASARTLRPMIVALLIVLGLNLAFAVLTLVFQDRILDYQVAADPGFGQLDATVLLALHSYLLAAQEYPPWLRFIEGAQVVALIVLLVIARRPAIRSVYARDAATRDPDPGRPRTGREITCLIVLTPLIAELAWGSTRFSEAWALPLFGPAYAGAALLIRETVRRRGLGWGSVLLFGTAYGLAEEGLALQSLTSTGMYRVAGWAPRVAGINTAYTVMVLPYHAVFSIALPILRVDLRFPRHRSSPDLRTRGLICSALALILGLGLMRLVAAFNDPGYQVPLPYAAAIVGLIAGCVGLALRRAAPS
ncbi:MAG: hypothetical protein QOC75_1416, partial [Pseudonocardiales bacterium]|nr:hypothetical protein [Pseudonocardiales bacterium]